LPTVSFIAPNAPEPCAAGPGFQWFPISRLDPQVMRQGVESASPSLDAFLDAELARAGLGGERLALVGFSQGTMMSLHVGLRRNPRPAAIVGYSGLLASPPVPGDVAPPPVLLVHGDADPMIPAEQSIMAAIALGHAGVPVQWHISPNTPHGIDPTGLALGGAFLSLAFRGLLKPKDAQEVSCATG
jgi:phospholipase/carboxylesterase